MLALRYFMGNSAYIKAATSKSTVTFVEIDFILLFDYKKREKAQLEVIVGNNADM